MLDLVSSRELPTVLLIDDDLVSREVMATLLTMSGFSVHTAEGGEAAVEQLAGGELLPGVILMDAQMPGLSENELVAELRARSTAKLFAVSSSRPSEALIEVCDGFLQKPFPPDALRKLLESHPTEPEPEPQGLDPEETVVNRETLAQLREMMPEAAVRQIYAAIVADLGRRTEAMEAALAKGDDAEVRRIAHAIKGGCSMAGAAQAARLGAMIEDGVPKTGFANHVGSVNQLDNNTRILTDLRTATLNLQRMLEAEFQA
jgi:CheY-like chemotaxis protein